MKKETKDSLIILAITFGVILFVIGSIVGGLKAIHAIAEEPNDLTYYDEVMPKFRVAYSNESYYVEYFAHDSKSWQRCQVKLPTKEDALAVIDESENVLLDKYKVLTER